MGIFSKSIYINKDQSIYGTLAEIGAGQEVAHSLFRVGGASSTIAKTMSAYDMKFSDAIYGSDSQYVCQKRLIKMLNKEFQLLQSRLSERSDKTRFFVFANTVATGSQRKKISGHGWLGVLFQHKPQASLSQVTIHVRLEASSPTAQQTILGLIGINLLYGCFKYHDQLNQFFYSLKDEVDFDCISIDYINFTGSCFKYVDNKKITIQLVNRGLTRAIMFDHQAQVVAPSVNLYDKYLIAALGNFRPITVNKLAVFHAGYAKHSHVHGIPDDQIVFVAGLSLKSIKLDLENEHLDVDNDQIIFDELYRRIKMLAKLGISVVVSNFCSDFDFSQCLNTYSSMPKALVIGSHCLSKVLDQSQYEDFNGGLLEALGLMVSHNTILYIYPVNISNSNNSDDEKTLSCDESVYSCDTFERNKKLILDYMKYSGLCYDLDVLEKVNFQVLDKKTCLSKASDAEVSQMVPKDYLASKQVLQLLKDGDFLWKDYVPKPIVELLIKY